MDLSDLQREAHDSTLCPTCEGCGQVTGEGVEITPWSAWLDMPVKHGGPAILLGFVSPRPCPDCQEAKETD